MATHHMLYGLDVAADPEKLIATRDRITGWQTGTVECDSTGPDPRPRQRSARFDDLSRSE